MNDSFRCVEAVSLDHIAEHLPAWFDLQDRALEDNYYLSPSFVTAAMRHYASHHQYRVVFVYLGTRLVAVAPFSVHRPSLRIPLRMLRGMESPHGYLSHPLIDREHVHGAVSALLDWMERPANAWQVAFFSKLSAGSPFLETLERELRRRRRVFDIRYAFQRATLVRRRNFDQYLEALPRARRKTFRRRWVRLQQRGRTEIVLHRDVGDAAALAQRFMQIECRGWKGERGSALLSRSTDTEFFLDIVQEAARHGNLFFVELQLDGRPIAMTANFICGTTLFAFKVAYDPAYAQYSPGTLAEVMTVKLFHETPGLTFGDGGANEESYISAYWRDLVPMHHVLIAMPRVSANVYVVVATIVNRIKRGVLGVVERFWRAAAAVLSVESTAQLELMNYCLICA